MREKIIAHTNARGFVLIEALIGLLLFSIGILGLVAFQAAASKSVVDGRFRTEAAIYADELFGRMSTTADTNLTTDFGASGSKFLDWKNSRITCSTCLPGGTASLTVTAVKQSDTTQVMPGQYQAVLNIGWTGPGNTAGTYSVASMIF